MGKKLFVGGLSWNTADASLRQAFERFGEVADAKVITDRETGRSRGFGFVTMPDDAAAATAMAALDGQPIDGRAVKVSEAQEKSPRRDFGARGADRDFGGAPRSELVNRDLQLPAHVPARHGRNPGDDNGW